MKNSSKTNLWKFIKNWCSPLCFTKLYLVLVTLFYMTPGRMCVPTWVHQIKMFDNNLRIWKYKQNWSFPLLIFVGQICTVCNQGLGQFHIHYVNFVIGRDILSTDVVLCKPEYWSWLRCSPIIQMLLNISTGLFSLCLYPWLIQGLPNLISIFQIFGRFWTILDVDVQPGCNRIQEFCDRSCFYNGYNMYILDPCSSCYNHNDMQCRSTSLNTICNCCTSFTVV